MNFMRFSKYKELYKNLMPIMLIYPTIIGIEIGINANRSKTNETPIDMYSNMIGYTSIGFITGITYPISYPLFGCYVVYKNYKLENRKETEKNRNNKIEIIK